MEISFWWLTLIAPAAMAAGVCLGRVSAEGGVFRERQDEEEDVGKPSFLIGSPVSGEIADIQEGGHPTVVICPDADRIYAPAAGRIRKIFPQGNALLFDTEFGAELYIRVGDSEDELLDRYYRPRIVQNEVVGKGKLLLEFDRKGLAAQGVSDSVVIVLAAGAEEGNILADTGAMVRTGEELLKVR